MHCVYVILSCVCCVTAAVTKYIHQCIAEYLLLYLSSMLMVNFAMINARISQLHLVSVLCMYSMQNKCNNK